MIWMMGIGSMIRAAVSASPNTRPPRARRCDRLRCRVTATICSAGTPKPLSESLRELSAPVCGASAIGEEEPGLKVGGLHGGDHLFHRLADFPDPRGGHLRQRVA